MGSTRVSRHFRAPRAVVYRALLDPRAVERWRVPLQMKAEVHTFDSREGGLFRVSLTYDKPAGRGKTTPATDTYHGHFVRLIPDQEVVEVSEFETADPAMQGEMTITYRLADAGTGTELVAIHEGVPPGVSAGDNETGWNEALGRLASMVESSGPGAPTETTIGREAAIPNPALLA